MQSSVHIWYPYHEYYLDLTQNIFKNYLEAGKVDTKQIFHGLDEIKKRYFKLIEFIKFELGLNGEGDLNKIKIQVVDEQFYKELEQYNQLYQ